MIRLRITEPYKEYKTGDIIEVTPNIAHGLLELGVAVKSKEMSRVDYKRTNIRKKNV